MSKRKIISGITLLVLLCQLLFLPVMAAHKNTLSKGTLLASMTTEEKVQQMLMPTFRYYDGAGVTSLNEEQEEFIANHGFAGVILFAQNNTSTEQSVTHIDELQRANCKKEDRPQLLVSVDQEGAGITRLSHGTQGPGNMALGATGNSAYAEEMGGIIGQELSAIGYNVDFAPVVDVNSNPSNPIIGVRSFSDDANTVATFGNAFVRGLKQENIITSLKHFPGHGDTSTDSHTGLPRIEKTYDELKKNELIPFASCIENGVEMIMTAHIQYPQIEKTTYTSIKDGTEIELPATLSKTIITDILRGDLGYNGVVVTDAMNMSAIASHFEPLDAAKLAINAGVDIILMPGDTSSKEGLEALDQYIKDIAALAESGDISMENINKAVDRILTLKENNGLLTVYDGSDLSERIQNATRVVGSERNHEKEWEIAQNTITLVKNAGQFLPITNSEKTVILVPYANEVLSGEFAVERLQQDGLIKQNMDISVFLTNGKTVEEMQEAVAGAKNVLAVTEQYSEAGLAAKQYTNLDAVADYVHENGGKMAFLSCNLPYDVARLQKGDAILLAYSCKGMTEKPDFSKGSVPTYGVSIPAGIYTAFNKHATLGKLPVSIPALDTECKYTAETLYTRGYGLQYENSVDPDEPTTSTTTTTSPTKLNGIVKGPDGKWAMYTNGKVNTSYTGIAKNQYGWWRVKNGYVDFNANGIYRNEYGWWKTTNGKVTFDETGIFKNEYGWWRVVNSKVDFKASGIYKNQYGWWKTTGGKVTFKENGVFKNEYGWWKVQNSKVDFGFTGIAKNQYGRWYVKNGKVDFTKNGKVRYNGYTYTVKNGKVK